MQAEPRSEHCALMSRPGGPPKPAARPADCLPDAAYIKTIGGGHITLPGNAGFPIVFEGGDGDDAVTVVGGGQRVIVDGGRGNDSLLVQSEWTWLASRLDPSGTLLVAALAIVFATIAVLGWRALAPGGDRPR